MSINQIDISEQSGTLTKVDNIFKQDLQSQYILKCIQEDKGRQRSRDWWIKGGDKNTKFFHAVASAHKRVNCIKTLTIDDVPVIDKNAIIFSFIHFFQDLYTTGRDWLL